MVSEWGISDYNNFLSEAKELFGVDHFEAQVLYRDMGDLLEMDSLTTQDLRDYGPEVSDLIPFEEAEVEAPGEYYDLVEAEAPEEIQLTEDEYYDYELKGVGDEWLEAGEEIEVSSETEGGTAE